MSTLINEDAEDHEEMPHFKQNSSHISNGVSERFSVPKSRLIFNKDQGYQYLDDGQKINPNANKKQMFAADPYDDNSRKQGATSHFSSEIDGDQ